MELSLSPAHPPILYDAVDDPVVSRFRWRICFVGPAKKPYAFTWIQNRILGMHRLILANACQGLEVDHINGNGLDNRRENLRVCTISQNRQNASGWARRKCPYKGVSKAKKITGRRGGSPWETRICYGGKQRVVGNFKDPILAAQAYDQEARIHHGKFARLNFPNPGERGLA